MKQLCLMLALTLTGLLCKQLNAEAGSVKTNIGEAATMVEISGDAESGITRSKQLTIPDSFTFKGNLITFTEVEISLKSISGKCLFQQQLKKGANSFSYYQPHLIADIYLLTIGKTSEYIYLTNGVVTLTGYFDDLNNELSNLEFSGIDKHYPFSEYVTALPRPSNPKNEWFETLSGSQLSAFTFIYQREIHGFLKPFYDRMKPADFESESGQWLQRTMDSLQPFSSGIVAPDFSFPDSTGKVFSLNQFKGKIVVLDAWASWCNPCRIAIREVIKYYSEFKDKVQFISVSVDDDKNKWLVANNKEAIPWLSLWDSTGFKPPSDLKSKYGFQFIPFIAVIDPAGLVIRRDILDTKELYDLLKKLTDD